MFFILSFSLFFQSFNIIFHESRTGSLISFLFLLKRLLNLLIFNIRRSKWRQTINLHLRMRLSFSKNNISLPKIICNRIKTFLISIYSFSKYHIFTILIIKLLILIFKMTILLLYTLIYIKNSSENNRNSRVLGLCTYFTPPRALHDFLHIWEKINNFN